MTLLDGLTETFIAGIVLWTLIVTAIAFRNMTRTAVLRPSYDFMAIGAITLFVVPFNLLPMIHDSRFLKNMVSADVVLAPGFIVVALLILGQKLASAVGLKLSNRQQVFLYAVVFVLILANCWWLYLLQDFENTRRG